MHEVFFETDFSHEYSYNYREFTFQMNQKYVFSNLDMEKKKKNTNGQFSAKQRIEYESNCCPEQNDL